MSEETVDYLKQCNAVQMVFVCSLVVILTFLLLENIDWGRNVRSKRRHYKTYELSYGYTEQNGPNCWKTWYPASNGECQSPININSSQATCVEPCDPLIWCNYNVRPKSMILTNTGHTVLLTGAWRRGEQPKIMGGPFGDKVFMFQHASFRWGRCDNEGSEHTIDFNRYPLEMQLQHTNMHNLNEVLYLSYIFQVSLTDNPNLDELVNSLWEVTPQDTYTCITAFPLEKIQQPFIYGYYSYAGSLTYPPCTENVLWIVYPEPINISSKQIEQFRCLKNRDGRIMTNSRPVQPINNREVYFYDTALM